MTIKKLLTKEEFQYLCDTSELYRSFGDGRDIMYLGLENGDSLESIIFNTGKSTKDISVYINCEILADPFDFEKEIRKNLSNRLYEKYRNYAINKEKLLRSKLHELKILVDEIDELKSLILGE